MNELQLFQNNQFGKIRTIKVGEKDYFVGNDIARALGYDQPHKAVNQHCKGGTFYTVLTNGGNQETKIIPESDVYRLIIKSKLPQAEEFEKWVFDEVLPSIRKNGMYATDELLDNPDLLIATATRLKEEKEKRLEAERINALNAPKVLFADSVAVSNNSILVNELAKLIKQNGIDIGQNKLFEWLRNEGYLIKKKGELWNTPSQYAMERDWFEVKVRVVNNPDGSVRTTRTTKVTGKGQLYFVNRLLGK